MASDVPGAQAGTRRDGLLAAGCVSAALVASALPLILLGVNRGRAAFDALRYHLPEIRDLVTQTGGFDLSNPLTATTPGYHLAVASLARILPGFGEDAELGFRLLSLAVGVVLVASLGWWLGRRLGAARGSLLALPFALSPYVVASAAWNLPDDLAWLGVLLVLVLALRASDSPARWMLVGLVTLPLVLTRQIHLWSAAVVWTAAWFGAAEPELSSRSLLGADLRARLARLGAALAGTLPAFLAIAWFYREWGGLTPSRFQGDHQGPNLATPAFVLTQFAILGVFFAGWLWPTVRGLGRRGWAFVAAAALVGLVLAAVPETTYDTDSGRFGGWWALAKLGPEIAGRSSPALLGLAPMGGAVVAVSLLGLPVRARLVLLAALAGFLAAQSSTSNSWQRYHEPLVLMWLALGVALARGGPGSEAALSGPVARVWRWVGPILLSALLGGLGVRAVMTGGAVEPGPPSPEHWSPDDPWSGTELGADWDVGVVDGEQTRVGAP
ncbi:MAG: hypothetical protein AAFU70_02785 [Planctomycetota bacterium]